MLVPYVICASIYIGTNTNMRMYTFSAWLASLNLLGNYIRERFPLWQSWPAPLTGGYVGTRTSWHELGGGWDALVTRFTRLAGEDWTPEWKIESVRLFHKGEHVASWSASGFTREGNRLETYDPDSSDMLQWVD